MGGCGIAIKKRGSPVVMLLMMEFSRSENVTIAVGDVAQIVLLVMLLKDMQELMIMMDFLVHWRFGLVVARMCTTPCLRLASSQSTKFLGTPKG